MTRTTVARVTEISAASPESFDDAVKIGIERATRTLKNVEGAWVKEMKVVVTGDQVTEYRVSMQVTFILDD